MSQIWFIFKHILEKYPWRRLQRRPRGAAAPWGGGIFQTLLKNETYLAHPIFKIAIGLAFQNVHRLGGDASYQDIKFNHL